MSVPLDQSVLDLLRQSPAGPLLDRPVNDVLREMGLPALPEITGLPPLPELPPLPVLDLAALAKPLTDLAGGFGTGVLPSAAPGAAEGVVPALGHDPAAAQADPAQVMQIVSGVLQTATTLGSTAVQMVMTLWQSMAAMEAAEKGAEAAKDTTAVAQQSAQTSVGVASAAGSVFQGASLMAAVIAKFVASVTAAAPFLTTGAGQVFLVGLTTETIAEALAVVAKTRGELTVHSAAMTETGTKVPVTNAPDNVDPMQAISQVMQILGPLSQLATSLPQQVTSIHQALNPPKTLATPESKDADQLSGDGFVGGGGLGGMPVGGGGFGAAPGTVRQLTPWGGGNIAGPLGAAATSAPAGQSVAPAAMGPRGGPMSSGGGLMPMGAAGAAGMARGAEGSTDGLRGQLVTEQHGNEVVGEIEGASLPVVGAVERVTEVSDTDPPDKALTL